MKRGWRPGLALVAAVGLAAAAPARAQVKGWPSETMPQPLPARPAVFPHYEIRTLSNGLRVVVVEHHEQPAVSLRILVGAGAAQDVPGKIGIANLVASLLDQGTATRTAQQIADEVDTIGGSISVGAGTDVTFAYLTVLKDSVAAGLGLLSEIIRSPAFTQGEFDRQREQLRSTLRVSYQDPDYLAAIVFDRLVYGLHPYGFPALGTPASIERIIRTDLVDFHGRYFVPGNAILAVAGDITAAEAFAAAERAFGGWTSLGPGLQLTLPPPPPTRRVVVVDVPAAVQTAIRVGQLGIRRAGDDFTAVDLAVRILGGDGANRLQRILRTQRGLTYGASADLHAYRLLGDIVAVTDTRPEATGEALRVIVDEFFRLQREQVGSRELDGAKACLAGGFPLGIETPDDVATKVLTALFYGLPLKDLETFRERVNAVTADDIQRVTRAYLRPSQLSMVLVGSAGLIGVLLDRVGIRATDMIRAADLDVTAEDLRRPSGSAEAAGPRVSVAKAMTREVWQQVRSVLDAAATAAGGFDALRAVKTIRATARTVVQTPAGPMRVTTRTFVEYPARMRVDATLPAGELVQAYVDGTAWLKDATGVRDAPTPMRDEFAQGLRRDWIALLLAASADRVMGRPLPDERGLGGRTLRVVELWSDELSPVRVAVDSATNLIAWISHEATGPGGRVTIRESYDDYRDVKGVRFPFTAVVRQDNAIVLERTLTDVQINVAFPSTFFQKGQ